MASIRCRSKLSLLSLIVAALAGTGAAFAGCEPCEKVLNFDESMIQADLVIVGRVLADPPAKEGEDTSAARPDTVKVEVWFRLKGKADGPVITANSWDGDCDRGIVVDDGTYVMVLKKGAVHYETLNNGCSLKTLPFEGEDVLIGEQRVNFDTLRVALDKLNKD